MRNQSARLSQAKITHLFNMQAAQYQQQQQAQQQVQQAQAQQQQQSPANVAASLPNSMPPPLAAASTPQQMSASLPQQGGSSLLSESPVFSPRQLNSVADQNAPANPEMMAMASSQQQQQHQSLIPPGAGQGIPGQQGIAGPPGGMQPLSGQMNQRQQQSLYIQQCMQAIGLAGRDPATLTNEEKVCLWGLSVENGCGCVPWNIAVGARGDWWVFFSEGNRRKISVWSSHFRKFKQSY
ncbi:hypothetical protein BC938DRAFT_477347 [Jimgerdemannia flammicorona]|uniref:Uncharacterized protein n=1 Tax=Jimgerdemannia flammicorona TaxID=994334 RepID=A0A433PAE9_9FUNG|nr:hypothetical protein BC938DRAFT_477347 [Jimgerdemannia flammicorona]